jgi:CO/xanthine dehydrogenase FAD-binding subunit
MTPGGEPSAFQYHRPATVEQALAVLAEVGHEGQAWLAASA